jgi:hypothetical protein
MGDLCCCLVGFNRIGDWKFYIKLDRHKIKIPSNFKVSHKSSQPDTKVVRPKPTIFRIQKSRALKAERRKLAKNQKNKTKFFKLKKRVKKRPEKNSSSAKKFVHCLNEKFIMCINQV